MRQTEFSLLECYTLACYGLYAVINAGRLEGFTKEEDREVQKDLSQDMCDLQPTV